MTACGAIPQTYQLLIVLPRSHRVRIGCLGVFDFPAGAYVYTGSAKRNMDARIRRHLAGDKTLRWHLDYLTTLSDVSVREIGRYTAPECEINRLVAGVVVADGFGASDCRHGCGSHLKYLGEIPAMSRQPAPR